MHAKMTLVNDQTEYTPELLENPVTCRKRAPISCKWLEYPVFHKTHPMQNFRASEYRVTFRRSVIQFLNGNSSRDLSFDWSNSFPRTDGRRY